MKEKLYDYENFSKCKQLLHEFKNAKKSKNNFGNIFKIIIENRQIAVRVQNLATESFKFIFHPFGKITPTLHTTIFNSIENWRILMYR